MKSIITSLPLALVGLTLTGLNASAGLIGSTTYNGHTYELWEAPGMAWKDARDAAAASGGHLATLTDAAETAAVYGALIGNGFFTTTGLYEGQAWLGGYTADLSFSTTDPNNWAWVTGEPWNAFAAGNFGSGEPNGDSSGLSINRFGTSEWNDEGGYTGGYILERGPSVPDSGSAVSLLGLGLALVASVVPRRQPR